MQMEAFCQDRDLQRIPKGLPLDIRRLNLSVNRIQSLTIDNLTQYSSVHYLNLRSNGLEFVQPGTFTNLSRLEVLDLADNFLDLSQRGLGSIPHLRRLELGGNSLYNGVVEAFLQGALQLHHLSLARNSLTKLTASTFQGCPSLTHLDLQHNIIIEIESGAFSSLPNLSTLDLAMNSITCVVNFSLTQLQVLNLSRNSIESFQVADSVEEHQLRWLDLSTNNLLHLPLFPHRNRLEHLDLSRNSIQDFSGRPSTLDTEQLDTANRTQPPTPPPPPPLQVYFPKLLHLEMSYNEITALPPDLFLRMPRLVFLNLSNNCLDDFSLEAGAGLDALTVLDLSSNSLVNLTLAPGSLPHLRLLYLQENRLHSVPHNAFRGLHSLYILSLQSNSISICGGGLGPSEGGLEPGSGRSRGLGGVPQPSSDCLAFHGMRTLRYLYLKDNGIQSVPALAFLHTPLSVLDLSINPGLRLHPTSLDGLEVTLTRLSLRGNGLSSLPLDLAWFPGLRVLDASENHLSELVVGGPGAALEHLQLSNNNFQALGQAWLGRLNATLRTLTLQGNPFNCCQAAWLHCLERVQVLDRPLVQCRYPGNKEEMHRLFDSDSHLGPASGLCMASSSPEWSRWNVLGLALACAAFLAAAILGTYLLWRRKVGLLFVHHVKA
uniref:Leucine-rich repeat-containing protein 32-like n=2 Tax=Callorhinchus milii TaxID=7868 RepID=A0A4W3H2V7_CALMI|eukprot:gi/632990300/ref/XP_007884105.1/ PREDICTED: leucine-rich repeat-containing protein 32-like [Callorhinchus milii]